MAHSIAKQTDSTENGLAGDRLRVTFDVVVTDPQSLWHAAARIAFQQPGTSIADVEDVLGPAEDPLVAECLAMVCAPDAIPGCTPACFTLTAVANPSAVETRERAIRSLAVREFLAAGGGATKQ